MTVDHGELNATRFRLPPLLSPPEGKKIVVFRIELTDLPRKGQDRSHSLVVVARSSEKKREKKGRSRRARGVIFPQGRAYASFAYARILDAHLGRYTQQQLSSRLVDLKGLLF